MKKRSNITVKPLSNLSVFEYMTEDDDHGRRWYWIARWALYLGIALTWLCGTAIGFTIAALVLT